MNTIRKTQIERIASDLASSLNLRPGFDLGKLLPSLSFELKSSDEFKDISGALFIKDGKKTIVVNSSEKEERQRFTIAHELAHDILQHNLSVSLFKKDIVFYRSTNNPQQELEYEANYFAACFLMPKEFLLNDLESMSVITDETVNDLAKLYKVSLKAMAIRLSELGFV